MSNITSVSSDATRELLSVAALTVWTHDGPQAWSPDVLEPGTPELDAFRAALASGSAWLDLQLATDVQRWMPADPKLLEHPVRLSRSAEASHGR